MILRQVQWCCTVSFFIKWASEMCATALEHQAKLLSLQSQILLLQSTYTRTCHIQTKTLKHFLGSLWTEIMLMSATPQRIYEVADVCRETYISPTCFFDGTLISATAAARPNLICLLKYLTHPYANFTGKSSPKFGLNFRPTRLWTAFISKRSNISLPKYRVGRIDD